MMMKFKKIIVVVLAVMALATLGIVANADSGYNEPTAITTQPLTRANDDAVVAAMSNDNGDSDDPAAPMTRGVDDGAGTSSSTTTIDYNSLMSNVLANLLTAIGGVLPVAVTIMGLSIGIGLIPTLTKKFIKGLSK